MKKLWRWAVELYWNRRSQEYKDSKGKRERLLTHMTNRNAYEFSINVLSYPKSSCIGINLELTKSISCDYVYLQVMIPKQNNRIC